MNHPPTVDAGYFDIFRRNDKREPVEYIFRQIGTGPLTMWYVNQAGDVVEVTDQSQMPYDMYVLDQMRIVRETADATGKTHGSIVDRPGHRRVVIEWYDDKPATAPTPQPSNSFANRTIETAFILRPPTDFMGRPVIAHAFIPADFGALDAHLLVYYTGPDVFWAPTAISQDGPVFGVGQIDYDDDAQKDIPRELESDMTFSAAMLRFTAELAAHQSVNLA